MVLVPVVDVGLNVAVTPVGKPVALNATLPAKPPVRVIVAVLVPLAPRLTVRLAGLTDNAKSAGGGALIVRLIVAVRVRPPPVPVTVTVAGPVVAVLEAASVRLALAPVVETGLNAAVTPLGSPLAVNATLLANPPVRAMLTLLVPLAPLLNVRLVALGESVKFGVAGALTVRRIVVVRVSPPPVPVIVTLAGPVVAVLEAARVSMLLFPVVEAGLNAAVTPDGNPLAARATLLVKPPLRVIAIVLVPFAPRLIVRLEELDESEKLGVVLVPGNGPRRNGDRKPCLVVLMVVQSSLSMPPVSPEFGFHVQKVKFNPATP